MAIADLPTSVGTVNPLSSGDESARHARVLHRIREVRVQQGVSLRSAARRLNKPIDQVRSEEHEHTDLKLSDLYRWQRVLEVPVTDLLVDLDCPLSEPVLKRARLVKIMKTALAIGEVTTDAQTQRLVDTLVSQLVELMPELKEVSPWHSVGQRRSQDELGRAAERVVPDSLFADH